MSAAPPTTPTVVPSRPQRGLGVEVSPHLCTSPYISTLIYNGDQRAIGIWLASLIEMHRLDPPSTLIALEELTALGGTKADAVALVGVGLWSAVDDETFSPCRDDPNGTPLWRPGRPLTRPPIPNEVRNAVYARDGHRCVICSATEDLTLDHIYPWSLGGPDAIDNLRVLCRSCNSRKGARV